jgi:transcriptional regulator with XRE-family HTH domain
MRLPLHPTEARSEIAGVVRARRREQGLRQEELAIAAGVSTKTLHNLEAGMSNPRIDTLLRIFQGLGLALEIVARAPTGRIRRADGDAEWE